ncbi:hypothetical protein CVT25_001479 [Psilocybe cyanescens]|uniref:Uncharacterized protein n=1 Tax=Psilocybe cyanescens TaxID=93625 RepID=A0A409WNN6_PSICY|nr:hypothetical protein CVT25_001479 [Psilocybe cyanescens]
MADAADCCGICVLCCACFGPCCPKRKQNDDDEEFAASVERDGRLYEMDLFTNAQPAGHSQPIAVGGARGNDGSPQDPSRSYRTQAPDRITAHEARHAHLRDATYQEEIPQGNIIQNGRPDSGPPSQPSKPRINLNTPAVVAPVTE